MASFDEKLRILRRKKTEVFLGQSVDTSVLHVKAQDFGTLPILSSAGCAIRRPTSLLPKFGSDLRKYIGANGELIVDSGGFVLMKNPVEQWSAVDVARLYRRIDADWLVNLDVPPLPVDDYDTRTMKYTKTLENSKYLLAEFEDRLIPVIHGTCEQEFVLNAERIRKLSPSFRKIGVGGLVPYFQKSGSTKKPSATSPQSHIVNAISVARSVFPEAKVHVFGAGSVHTVLAVLAAGANSTDSIGWRQAAGLGSVYLPGKHRRLLTNRSTAKPCRPRVSEDDIIQLRQCNCPGCRIARSSGDQLEVLSRDFTLRSLHNIWVLYQETWGYVFSQDALCQSTFLEDRLSEAWLHALESVPSRGFEAGDIP